ncbi:hypothetical protein EDC01DRAFT_763130 [Geopyxis carbonaria]|nr:hypothetical protein EDC01DRAFT_763130 [Geopyxis carbonaria]
MAVALWNNGLDTSTFRKYLDLLQEHFTSFSEVLFFIVDSNGNTQKRSRTRPLAGALYVCWSNPLNTLRPELRHDLWYLRRVSCCSPQRFWYRNGVVCLRCLPTSTSLSTAMSTTIHSSRIPAAPASQQPSIPRHHLTGDDMATREKTDAELEAEREAWWPDDEIPDSDFSDSRVPMVAISAASCSHFSTHHPIILRPLGLSFNSTFDKPAAALESLGVYST